MFGISRLWLILGGAVIGLLAGTALLLFAYAGSSARREVYIYAAPGWAAHTIETAKIVRVYPSAKCDDLIIQGIARAVAKTFGVAMAESPSKGSKLFRCRRSLWGEGEYVLLPARNDRSLDQLLRSEGVIWVPCGKGIRLHASRWGRRLALR